MTDNSGRSALKPGPEAESPSMENKSTGHPSFSYLNRHLEGYSHQPSDGSASATGTVLPHLLLQSVSISVPRHRLYTSLFCIIFLVFFLAASSTSSSPFYNPRHCPIPHPHYRPLSSALAFCLSRLLNHRQHPHYYLPHVCVCACMYNFSFGYVSCNFFVILKKNID